MKFYGLLLLVCFTLAAHAASTLPPIAGVWRFQQEVDYKADGSVVTVGPKLGYRGLLVLTPDGYASVVITPEGRKWTVSTASAAEYRETVEAGSAYSGPYRVDPKTQTVTIDVYASVDPSVDGTQSIRHYELNGDTLKLSGPWTLNGEKLGFTITFTRVKGG